MTDLEVRNEPVKTAQPEPYPLTDDLSDFFDHVQDVVDQIAAAQADALTRAWDLQAELLSLRKQVGR
jgi:hypothetical protein